MALAQGASYKEDLGHYVLETVGLLPSLMEVVVIE